MIRLNKLTALAAAVALSGGLAACGGGGSSTSDMMPDPQQACEADGGRWNADMTCTTASELQAEQIQALQAQIAALRTQLGLGPSDDIGSSITELQNELAALQKQVDDAAEEAAMAAKKAAAAEAGALFTGMDTDDGTAGADLAITFGGADDGVTATYGDSTAVTATVSINGTALDPAPEVEATDTAVPALGAWMGTELFVDTAGEAPSNTVVVYTDVDPNTSNSFVDQYLTAADGTVTGTSLTIAATTSGLDHVGLISAPAFMHAGQKDHAPDAAADNEVLVQLSGTFHGARGQYECEAAAAGACVSHEDNNGVRLTGTWIFVPDPGAMVSIADSTYLYFGWWLRKTSAGPEVDVFHGVTEPAASTEAINVLSGTATYSGSAAGKYAIDPVAPGTYASGGHWTADATLTADFENETNPGTISGMVNNFMAGGEMMDWSVSLGETALVDAGTFDSVDDASAGATAAVGDDVVWTIAGEAAPEAGSWSGALHGQTATADGGNNIPSGVTGEFAAVYSEGGHNIGHMVGAFGAHVDE